MIVAGTGHRPNKIGPRLNSLCGGIHAALFEMRPDRVISGMADGFDMLLAGYASMMGIPWTAAVPFPGQHTGWPEANRDAYNRLLERADDIVIVSPSYEGPWTYQRRNEWMVDHCDVLLAFYDGSAGGTRNCLKYAERVGREVRYVRWAETAITLHADLPSKP